MKALPILMYHHVSPEPGLVTVSPQAFQSQIAGLAKAGWRSAGLDEVAAFYRGEKLPSKTVVITFDDGYLDNLVHAHPVLLEYGMKAVLYVVTGWLGEGPVRQGIQPTPNHRTCKELIASNQADDVMLRWSELEKLYSAGTFEFHSHTHTHTRWDKQIADPLAREEALSNDLAQSRATLVQQLGCCSSHLCWPQGYYDADYVRIAQSQGFDYLYTTEKRVNLPTGSPLRIGRIVTKEKGAVWIRSRSFIFSTPWLGKLYGEK